MNSMTVRLNPLSHILLRSIIAFCFAVAALGHFRMILLHGCLPYRFAPLPMNAFWTGLAFLDLLAAACILWRLRAGLIFGTLLLATDLAVILYAMHLFGLGGWPYEIRRQEQFLFFGFLLACLFFTSTRTAL